jgi:heme A synthase
LALPAALVLLVLFQGALGMWTVTQLVHPGIVFDALMEGCYDSFFFFGFYKIKNFVKNLTSIF